ncbi:MAG: hypothetical protein K1000chlam2_00252 [Chlamydiae bacterium]|nr:hypothetical protein [Chlamydiota bacterium]
MATIQSSPIFQAAWPKALDPAFKNILVKIAQFILKIVLFPFIFVRRLLRNYVFHIIIPGQPVDCTWEGKSLLQKYGGQSIQLKTPDGATLDGAFFPGKNPKKAILYATGNCHQWELLDDKLQELKPHDTSILIINPRGVGKSSKGTESEEGYALDYYTASEYLIKQHNLDPENILSIGFSMGGATTALGAALIQEKYPDKKISAINICSFSSLQLTIQKVLGKWGTLAKFGSMLLGVDMHVKEAWDKLKGERCVFFNPEDGTIPTSASLFQAVKDNSKGRCYLYEMLHIPDHSRPFFKDELEILNAQIQKSFSK